MILCNNDCIPCCDFCTYAIHDELKLNLTIDGHIIKGGPIGCSFFTDKEHQEIANDCGYCDSFHCMNVK